MSLQRVDHPIEVMLGGCVEVHLPERVRAPVENGAAACVPVELDGVGFVSQMLSILTSS